METLVSLNDDVLLLVFSYIHGEDALNAALTCKRLFPLALPRVAAWAYCWNGTTLHQMCTYMLSARDPSDGPRARQLRVLSCSPVDKDTSAVPSAFETKQPIGLLLAEAHNLCVFRWSLFSFRSILFPPDPPIGLALISLRHLSVLELTGIDNEMVTLLQHITTLEVLILGSAVERTELEKQKTLPALLNTLASLIRLRTLSLSWFYPDSIASLQGDSSPRHSAPRFPAVVDISLQCCHATYLSLIQLCPNVSRLVVEENHSLHQAFFDTHAMKIMHAMHLPRLERLTLHIANLSLLAAGHFTAVRHLQLQGLLGEDQNTTTLLSHTLPVFRPQSIKLTTRFMPHRADPPTLLWEALAQQQPAVRIMDIEVIPHSYRPWCDTWPDFVPGTLRNLPLVALRFIVRCPPPNFNMVPMSRQPQHIERGLIGGPSRARRREALAAMPAKLAEKIPTLHMLAIAEEIDRGSQRPKGGAAAGRLYMNGVEEDMGGAVGGADWDKLSRTWFRFQWWSFAAPGIAPARLSDQEGEKAYRVLESALNESSTTVEDTESCESSVFDLL
ncbi:hypothetical protein C2E23DRAFT_849366 [Lenzites betulinus]|nr:hypothetical protein C2E23DRAFT_849366 [Lenzites betulinus]